MASFDISKWRCKRCKLCCWYGLSEETWARNINMQQFGKTVRKIDISHHWLDRAVTVSGEEWVLAEIHKEDFLERSCRVPWGLWKILQMKHLCVLSSQVVITENSDSRRTWERWAGDRGVCLPHYLFARKRKKNLKIHFSFKWYNVVWGYLIFL